MPLQEAAALLNARKTLSIAAKSLFQPRFKLTKEEPEIGSGRLLEQFDNARTQVLPRVIDCSGQTHIWSIGSRLPSD